jgi:hypothetical protein
MKHAEKIYDLLHSRDTENEALVIKLIEKNLKPRTILGFAAMIYETGVQILMTPSPEFSALLEKIENAHHETFGETLHWNIRDMFHIALHDKHKSTFSLKYTRQAYLSYIETTYEAQYKLTEEIEKDLESKERTKNK